VTDEDTAETQQKIDEDELMEEASRLTEKINREWVEQQKREVSEQCELCGEPTPELTLTADSHPSEPNLLVCGECDE
jgi:formylmethanofuran dehydrogenase subunit E